MITNIILGLIFLFYLFFAILCFYIGFKKIKDANKKRRINEIRSKFKIIKGEKYDSKN
jgi:hypothetical protein